LPTPLAVLPEHHLEVRLAALTNAERAREGVAAVAPSFVLAQAARHHAEEMALLEYFSHVSPTPGRRDVVERVALVGGAQLAVGENLAAVAVRNADLASRVVAGWMSSEGHRANLLRAEWTHVGYGVAEGRDGQAYVVQVFAADPNPLEFVHATWANGSSVAVRMELAATTEGWVSAGGVRSWSQAVPVEAGANATVVVDGLDLAQPTHLVVGWTRDPATAFIGQESGWFDPATGVWTPDWRSEQPTVEVERYSATHVVRDVSLQLAFERPPVDLVVLVDGRMASATITGTNAVVQVPGRPGARTVEVGLRVSEGRVRLVHRFEIEVGVDGVVALR
jgi:hypothetical protein